LLQLKISSSSKSAIAKEFPPENSVLSNEVLRKLAKKIYACKIFRLNSKEEALKLDDN